jgi:hypothetical protein
MITRKGRLDALITPADQEKWLKNPEGFNREDKEKAMLRLQEFEDHPASADCLLLLTIFASCCLPAPTRTERSFWSVSCCPRTGAKTWPRLACVSLSVMEVFVLGYHLAEQDRLWGLINVSKQELWKHYSNLENLRMRYPGIERRKQKYRSAGHDQIGLFAKDLETLRQLLSDQAILGASATLNLRLMQQRGTIYPRFHNPALARLMCSANGAELSKL